MMNFFQLKAFCAAAECGSFSQAAQELFVSQSHFSKTIAALETELDATLFRRGRNTIRLTEAGQTLLPWAKKTLTTRDEMLLELKKYQIHLRESLSIAITSSLAFYNLVAPIEQYRLTRQQAEVQIHEYEKDSILKYLDAGTVDVAITWLEDLNTIRQDYSAYQIHALLREQRCLVVSKNHPFAERKSICLEGAGEEHFIFPENKYQKEVYTNICRASGFEPQITAFYASIPTQLHLVAQNFGVSLLLDHMVSDYSYLGVRAIPIEPPVYSTLALVERRGDSSALTQQFIRYYSGFITKKYGST